MHPKLWLLLTRKPLPSHNERGFILPLVVGLGLALIILGLTSALVVQTDRITASSRRQKGNNLATIEAAADRLMLELSRRNNSILLGRNYDPINPRTGRNYLGADGFVNSGDETTTEINQWTTFNPSAFPCFAQAVVGAPTPPLSGTINGQPFFLRAYRYDPRRRQGTLLVEGRYENRSTFIQLVVSITPELQGYPGIVVFNPTIGPLWPAGLVGLRGRQILGRNANVYYNPIASTNPGLTGTSEPGESTRADYLDALFSSPTQDGATGDTITGTMRACNLFAWIPRTFGGTNLGVITSSQTLTGTGGRTPTYFQVERIDLAENETLTLDTTNGPVYIELADPTGGWEAIILRDQAQIVNRRSDNRLPQVGDARIIGRDSRVILHGRTCMENVFLALSLDELHLFTDGAGCPSGRNSNFEGVIWAEAIMSSKNDASNRDINYLGWGTVADTVIQPGATSGIYVPDDVSSLDDLLPRIAWPARYRFGQIKTWQRVYP